MLTIKFVDDVINGEDFNMKMVPSMSINGQNFKETGAEQSKQLLERIQKNAEKKGWLSMRRRPFSCVCRQVRVGIDYNGQKVEASNCSVSLLTHMSKTLPGNFGAKLGP